MATYKVADVQEKNADWKVISIEMSEGNFQEEVSVNRKNKKEEIFPGFDDIKVNATVEGDLWQSGAGKWYLFAPKPKAPGGQRGGNAAAITKAQETKREDIKDAQERKAEAISRAGSMRDATLVSLACLKDSPFPTDSEFKVEWEKWYKYFMAKADEPFA